MENQKYDTLEFWEQECIQLESMLEGLSKSYAVIKQMHDNAQARVNTFMPDRENVES